MNLSSKIIYTVWKVSKYGVISGPYFPVFGPNLQKKNQWEAAVQIYSKEKVFWKYASNLQ